jgi:hypothetical protein
MSAQKRTAVPQLTSQWRESMLRKIPRHDRLRLLQVSRVKPLSDHPYTGASSSRACCTPWSRQKGEVYWDLKGGPPAQPAAGGFQLLWVDALNRDEATRIEAHFEAEAARAKATEEKGRAAAAVSALIAKAKLAGMWRESVVAQGLNIWYRARSPVINFVLTKLIRSNSFDRGFARLT